MGTLKLFPALLFIFLAFDWVGTVGFGAKTPPDEVNALKLIGKSLGKRDWNFSVDPCSNMLGWVTPPNADIGFENNVTCNCTYEDNTVCHVVIISLKAQNLPGVLPLELGGLPFLQNLDLSRNFLNGTIPPGWGSSGLVMVSLLGNRLSGHIPTELGSITSLVDLNMEANQLSGPVPRELGRLIKLRRLLISSNPLTGQLPEEFARLTKMEDFRMSDTNISGKIPHFIQNWTKLGKLVIQGCPMEGPIPSGISGLNTLTDLRISDISGTGWSFPDLSKMLKMRTLILRNCLISGTIPEYIGKMAHLKTLDLSFNNLTGEIPKSFGSLREMKFMYLTSNMLTGSLPTWIQEKNQHVDVSYNNLTWASSEPNSCEQQTINLIESYSSTMNSSANSCLKKDFPCSGSKHCFLYINCGGKALHINDTTYEEDLKESGASKAYISEHWAFSSTGNFMDNGDNDKYIETNIPMLSMAQSYLYATARVSPLSLTYYGLCMINGNYTVKLHFAEIMFTNDATFGSLGRRIFDVYIQGKLVWKDFNIHYEAGGVGKPVVKNFTATVTRNTLEIRFLWAGKGTQSMPRRGVYGPLISAISVVPDFVPCSTGDKKLSAIVTVAIIASVLSVVLLVLVILWRAGWLRSKATRENELRGLDLQTGSFTLRQIKAATNNFDPKNKIGEGGFGPVYKGLLADGTIIAVKQLSSKSKQGNREFVNEIGMITALQHPNLVKLYGCCIEGNQLSLIYEYMENNSLARALFDQKEEFPLELDWPTRRKICIGIARGLAYLHEESRLKVVHRDIKATNILLDKDLNAKISDFGLAKLDEEENTHISTRIAGTLGYMAPEYAMHGYLTDKADVYSFGIVALEIVSGKSNMNCKPKEEGLYLLDWAIVLQGRGNLSEMIDPKLGPNFSMEEAIRILKVAILCTNNSPTLRPAMSSVVSMIEGQTVVDDLLSNTSFSADDILFKSIRSHSQQILDHAEIQTQSISIDGPWTGSSTSAPDLYPITLDSEIWDEKAIGNHSHRSPDHSQTQN